MRIAKSHETVLLLTLLNSSLMSKELMEDLVINYLTSQTREDGRHKRQMMSELAFKAYSPETGGLGTEVRKIK